MCHQERHEVVAVARDGAVTRLRLKRGA